MVSGWPSSYLFTMVARRGGGMEDLEEGGVDVAEERRIDGERERMPADASVDLSV